MTTDGTRELIAEARRMAPFYDKSGTLEVARILERLAAALEAATRERAAVPDAATEGESLASEVRRLRESVAMLEEKTKLEIEQRRSAERELSLVRAMPSGQVQSAQLARDLRAERDAALARIAEAAKLHQPQPGQGVRYCADCDQRWPCPTAVVLGLNEGDNDD